MCASEKVWLDHRVSVRPAEPLKRNGPAHLPAFVRLCTVFAVLSKNEQLVGSSTFYIVKSFIVVLLQIIFFTVWNENNLKFFIFKLCKSYFVSFKLQSFGVKFLGCLLSVERFSKFLLKYSLAKIFKIKSILEFWKIPVLCPEWRSLKLSDVSLHALHKSKTKSAHKEKIIKGSLLKHAQNLSTHTLSLSLFVCDHHLCFIQKYPPV